MGKSKRNSENWLVTYADLMTLLLVFFVLLYTLMPTIDQEVFDEFVSYFQQSSGFFESNHMKKEDYETQAETEAEEVLQEERIEYWQAFTDFLEEEELSPDIEVEMVSNGVKITLSDSLTFESGSSDLLPLAEVVLNEVAKKIDDQISEIEVQGHTDNVPISSMQFQSNWHLGAARSVSVVQYLQNQSVVNAERFKASSYGEYKPVADNETEIGKRRNRRVEIYLTDDLLDNTDREVEL